MSKGYNSFAVLRKRETGWGILNIVTIAQDANEHYDSAEARASRDASRKMVGWAATMPGETLTIVPMRSNTCQAVNNHDGFV